MALRHRLALAIALTLSAVTGASQAQAPTPGGAPSPSPGAGPVYIVTYFEVGAAAAGKTVGLLRQFAAATRKENGNAGFLALEEIARPARFAMVEVWRDKAALEAHGAAVGALRDKLQPLFASPFDIRTNAGLSVAGAAVGDEPRTLKPVYVLTHVDVFPAGKDQTIELLKQLLAAGRPRQSPAIGRGLGRRGRATRPRDGRAHPRLPRQARTVAGGALRRASLRADPLSGRGIAPPLFKFVIPAFKFVIPAKAGTHFSAARRLKDGSRPPPGRRFMMGPKRTQFRKVEAVRPGKTALNSRPRSARSRPSLPAGRGR